MDPAHDFLTPHPRPAGRWAAVGRGVGFVVLLVTACSPLWGLAVYFSLH